MSSKPSGSTTQTTKTEPWEGQQEYYKQIFSEAQNLYNQGSLGPKAYEGDTIANLSPEQLQAQDMIKNQAGTGYINNAQNLNNDIIAGKYLDVSSNPAFSQGLKDIKQAYQTGTAAQTDAAAANSGAFGGSAYNELVGQNTKSYGDSLNKFAGDIYNQGINQQMQALGMAPGLNQAGYFNANQLAGVGAQNQQQSQAEINALIEKFNLQNQSPITALQYYQGLIGGNLGGTTNQTNPYYGSSGLGTGLGTAAGAGLGYAFGGPMGGYFGSQIGGSLGGGLF